jgi:predicted AAA+ superfamily ATPase
LIFPTTGIPTFNYVRPDEYERFRAELQTLGRGLIVEGPSRTGKTTATKKAIEEIAPTATSVWIDSRNQSHIEMMRNIICSDFKGYIFIDDFHHLPEGEQDRVAWAIKQFADRAAPDAKITVIGINRVGYSLMGGLPEISGRVQSISLSKRQHPNKILELIEKGENVANIRFQHKDAIVEASGGSFFIAQQICYHLAVKK